MSEPVTNVQIEDVLSSIRRLVSEEIGQSGIQPLERKKPVVEDAALVLSPAQKIREEAAAQGEDLWDETSQMAPQSPAPVWWHRDFTEDQPAEEEQAEAQTEDLADLSEPEQMDDLQPEPEALSEPEAEPVAVVEEEETLQMVEQAIDPLQEDDLPEEPMFKSRLGGAMAGLEAAMPDEDEEWEPEEGEQMDQGGMSFDAMPWSGAVDVEEIVVDEFLEREPLSAQSEDDVMDAGEEVAEVEAITDMPVDVLEPVAEFEPEPVFETEPVDAPEIGLTEEPRFEDVDEVADAITAEAVEDEIDDIPFSVRPGERLFERLSRHHHTAPEIEPEPVEEVVQTVSEPMEISAPQEAGFEIDEEVLREMIRDVVRQELQGSLGERITRNVRKLVRREIQRAFSDLSK